MSVRKFEDLKTVEGKKVRIAQDVLKLLGLQKIKATSGRYFDSPFNTTGSGTQEAIKDATPRDPCRVCALGSMLCGLTINNGDFNRFSADSGQYLRTRLGEYFTNKELTLIEACFEGAVIQGTQPYKWVGVYSKPPHTRFHDTYSNSEDRLVAIMNNIISNRGKFVMPEEYMTGWEWLTP